MRQLCVRVVVVWTALAVAQAGAGGTANAIPLKPNDRLFAFQWGLRSIHAPQAWRWSTGKRVRVAVLDTGIDGTHPDLKTKLTRERYTCDQRADRDDSGDNPGHGTFAAGIIAATTHNRIGIAGVAPDARLISVRAAECPSGLPGYISAIRAAADLGADVINMSQAYGAEGYAYGAIGSTDGIKWAVKYAWSKGAVVVVAAGNGSFPLCGEPWLDVPVVCVGAINWKDQLALYSNHDVPNRSKYLVAPGGEPGSCEMDIVSTWPRTQATLREAMCSLPNHYATSEGTSFAAPHVSGVAALLSARGFDNKTIVKCLLEHADDLGAPGIDPMFGYGKVNAQAAVRDCRG